MLNYIKQSNRVFVTTLASIISGFALFLSALSAMAHPLEPGYLQINELGSERYQVIWKVPRTGSKPMPIDAHLPKICEQNASNDFRFVDSAFVASWSTHCPGGLNGQPIHIVGLDKTSTDTLVRITNAEGLSSTFRLTPNNTQTLIPKKQTRTDVATTYFLLGIEHILLGLDHLLFVFALLMIANGIRQLVTTITAFTLAHSVTLSAASLGYISVHIPPIEAIIALSIVFMAVELAKRDQHKPSMTVRHPWIIAFGFGLLHGLGFASALGEIGLPQNEIPVALLLFNLGVEAGQLLFIAVVILAIQSVKVFEADGPKKAYRAGTTRFTVYAIGSISSYWLITRIVSLSA